MFLIYLAVWYNGFGESMRVISGKYKGKNLDGFGIPGTRPTMDRVKESLFASIQNDIKDSVVLDLFAGSGALGIEALSNGAKEAYFVDSGIAIGKVLKQNLEGIEGAHLFLMDYQVALERLKKESIIFHIVFLDPPYHGPLLNRAVKELEQSNLLANNGLLILEYEEEMPSIHSEKFILQKEKRYGDKMVAIYRYKEKVYF